MKLEFRDLKADEIELRVGNTKRKDNRLPKSDTNPVVGFQVLLYKTARVDANILDETVGPFNWTKRYYQVKNTMFCSVGIKDTDTNEWVFKDDAGDDDFQTEQVKGEASDSFKRAGFAWGIGRKNLYYGPFIWIKCNDKINEFTKMYVSEIAYKDSIITKLVIRERNTEEIVYSYGKGKNTAQTSEKVEETPINEPKGSIAKEDLEFLNNWLDKISEPSRNRFYSWLDNNYGTMNIETLTLSQGKKVISDLAERKK